MWKKNRSIGMLCVVPLLLFGCGTAAVQTGDNPDQSKPIHSQSQTPPTLELKISGDTIRTIRGGYSWSYYDPKAKSMAGVEAETIAPQEMVNVEKARKVDKNADITLEFEEAPLAYVVYVWDATGNSKAFPGMFDLSRHVGKNVFEIRADWEQGNAGYVFALDVE